MSPGQSCCGYRPQVPASSMNQLTLLTDLTGTEVIRLADWLTAIFSKYIFFGSNDIFLKIILIGIKIRHLSSNTQKWLYIIKYNFPKLIGNPFQPGFLFVFTEYPAPAAGNR